jgi:hypothetical protein
MIDNLYKHEELGNNINLDRINGMTLEELKFWIDEQQKKYPDHFKLRLKIAWIECEPVIKLIGTKE